MNAKQILKQITESDSCTITWCDKCPFKAKKIQNECRTHIRPGFIKPVKGDFAAACPGDLCIMEVLYGVSHYYCRSNSTELMNMRKHYAHLALQKGVKYVLVYLRNPYLARAMWWNDTKTDW